MTEHPLADILREALDASEGAGADPVQGAVIVYTVDGRKHLGQVSWVSDDGHAFSLVRIWSETTRGVEHHDAAETPRHFSTAHVVEIHYYRAGA